MPSSVTTSPHGIAVPTDQPSAAQTTTARLLPRYTGTAGLARSPITHHTLGVPAIDPVRITVGQHHVLGLLALTTEDEPGIEHDLLTHAGFTLQPGDFLYTLPCALDDAAAIRAAVTDLDARARALNIRIGIDAGLASALEHHSGARAEPGAGRGPDAREAPALTTVVHARPAPVPAPRPVR